MRDPASASEAVAAQSHLTAILENTTDLVSTATPEARLLYLNRAGRRLAGWGEDEPITDRVIRDLHPDWAWKRIAEEALPAALAVGHWQGETALRHRAGHEIPVSQVVLAHRSSAGAIEYYSTIMRDISDRKRAEEALLASEARALESARLLEGLFDAIPDVIGVQDCHRRIIRYNAAGYRFLGKTPEEVQGRHCYELIGRVNPCDLCATDECLATKQPSRTEKYVAELDRWLEIRSYPVLNEQSEIVYIIEHLRDITERRRAEAALWASEERYRRIVETAHEGIWCIDADSRTSLVNQRMEEMLGYRPGEMLGRPLADFLRPEDVPDHATQIAARRQGQAGHFERRYRHASGEWRWMSVSATPQFDHQGRYLGSFAMFTDVTDRKRAEEDRAKLQEQLLQAQKMESVGRLAGGVAHDFNNMLQAILGNAALALQDLPSNSPLRESLEEIERSARRSADLTRQLLAFARKQTILPKVLDLNDTVSGMLKMLRRLIGEDIELVWAPGHNLWPVRMDPSQIDQILANLCVNARDAILGPGRVGIETSNVILDATYAESHADCVPGEYALLTVSDNGKGMDAETRAHLFEPFFTTKEQGKGTGLGLATVFGIVKQNHGMISVYSEPGQGTTIKVYLPRADDERSPAPTMPSLELVRGTETVLLVEDEEQILTLGRRILHQQGYTVLEARSPEEALKLATQHPGPIHLLITDVVMPIMTGRELQQRLSILRPGLRCLFMSGYTADVIAHQGVLDDGVQFLPKPFTVQSLAQRVREVLQPSPTTRENDLRPDRP